MGYRGVDVREEGDRLLFRAFLQDSAGLIVPSGTTQLRLYELQGDSTLKGYDFNSSTFITGVLTSPTGLLNQQKVSHNQFDTGLWTYTLYGASGFSSGRIYFAHVTNSSASPTDQMREFQYGDPLEGDAVLSKTLTEPTGVPSWNSTTVSGWLSWMSALTRNKIEQTETKQTLYNDVQSTGISYSDISDDGTMFTRGEWY